MESDELEALWTKANALEERGEVRKAFRLYLRCAVGGHAHSAACVSACYTAGAGTRRDLHQALRWTKVAIRLEAPNETYVSNLGVDYAMLGNWRRAKYWWERAVASGDVEAGTHVALCLLLGKGTRRDPHRAVRLLRAVIRDRRNMASEWAREEAMALLGALCARGIGTPLSLSQARQWLERANVDGDYPQAARALAALDDVEFLDLARIQFWQRLR
jgi:TPR repeat protein